MTQIIINFLSGSIQGDNSLYSRGFPLIDPNRLILVDPDRLLTQICVKFTRGIPFSYLINLPGIIDVNLCQFVGDSPNLPGSIFKQKIIYFRTIVLELSWWGNSGEYIKTAIIIFRLQSFLCNHAIIEKLFSNLLLDVLDYNKIRLIRKGVKNVRLCR